MISVILFIVTVFLLINVSRHQKVTVILKKVEGEGLILLSLS